MYWQAGPAACSSPLDSCPFPALLLQKQSKKVIWFELFLKSRYIGKDWNFHNFTHINRGTEKTSCNNNDNDDDDDDDDDDDKRLQGN